MVSIHYYARDDQKIWSQLGLAFAIVYAAMASINYIVQLTVVRCALKRFACQLAAGRAPTPG